MIMNNKLYIAYNRLEHVDDEEFSANDNYDHHSKTTPSF